MNKYMELVNFFEDGKNHTKQLVWSHDGSSILKENGFKFPYVANLKDTLHSSDILNFYAVWDKKNDCVKIFSIFYPENSPNQVKANLKYLITWYNKYGMTCNESDDVNDFLKIEDAMILFKTKKNIFESNFVKLINNLVSSHDFISIANYCQSYSDHNLKDFFDIN